ncbi:hypothetical protein ACLM5H_20710 [Fredinandcohnia humi]
MSTLTEAITLGDFAKAKQFAAQYDLKTLEDELFLLAYDEGSIAPYGFVCAMLIEKETSRWHYIASILLSMAINHLDGAYFTAFYHAKRASELSPDDSSYKEALLFYYEIPEQPLSREEALKIATEMLREDPKNKAAKRIK